MRRRSFIKALGVSGAIAASPALFAACGGDDDDAPKASATAPATATSTSSAAATPILKATSDEKIKIGFIALTDCASCVMAQNLACSSSTG